MMDVDIGRRQKALLLKQRTFSVSCFVVSFLVFNEEDVFLCPALFYVTYVFFTTRIQFF